MTGERHPEGLNPLRADARRNHGQILAAARDVFVERGPAAPLEDIVRRAGVGIGTLYRRFANRQVLMRAVVFDALTQTREAATEAMAGSPSDFEALRRYMHTLIDLRVSAVIPALLDDVHPHAGESRSLSAEIAVLVERMVAGAHADGTLRPDVTAADIGLILVRLSRPLPGGRLPCDTERALGHRHLDVFIQGLRPAADAQDELRGPALTFDDLRNLHPPTDTSVREPLRG